MLAENPLALSFLLPDDIYLLADERFTSVNVLAEMSKIPQVAEPEVAYKETVTFNYTGNYSKKYLIVVHYPAHDAMEPAHLNALESTLKRKEMGLNNVAIFNISKYPDVNINAVLDFFKPAKVLLLGKNALPAGLTLPALNQITQQSEYILLYSFSFNEMMGNKENTKAFWEQMKLL